MEADELTMALTKAINEFSGSLRTELAGQQCGDLSDVAALIEWLEALQEGVRLADREVVGTNMAKIRRPFTMAHSTAPFPPGRMSILIGFSSTGEPRFFMASETEASG